MKNWVSQWIVSAIDAYIDRKSTAFEAVLDRKLQPIVTALVDLQAKEKVIMENEQQIEAEEQAELTAIANLTTQVGTVATTLKSEADQISGLEQQVTDLKNQQTPVTQDQLEAIGAGLRARAASIQQQADALGNAVAPPAAPPVTPAS